MRKVVVLNVNSQQHEVLIEPTAVLLDVLRNQLGLTGAKRACDDGSCGACTVLIDGKAMNACLVLAAEVQGREITTIEGLVIGDKLDPIQEAFVEHDAVQCGYCTPGMILSATALLMKNTAPSVEDVKLALSGNLCRCTGYSSIISAVMAAAEKRRTVHH